MPEAFRKTAGATLLALALCAGAAAHPFHRVGQETYLSIRGGKLVVEYYTTYGPVQAGVYALRADADRDGNLAEEEVNAFLEKLAAKVLAGLAVTIDDRPLGLRYAAGTVSTAGPKYVFELAGTFLRFEAALAVSGEEIPLGPHVMRLAEGNFPGIAPEGLKYYVRAGPPTRGLKLSSDRRTLEWAFEYTAELARRAADEGPAVFRAIPFEDEEEAGALAALIGEKEVTLGFVLAALAIAAGLGAVHAFSPGHGKAIVAAYLIGSKGRVRDAVVLGLVVTLTHVASVLILGVAALLLLERFLPEEIYPWLGVVSGALVFTIGYWMLASRALGLGHHHSHGRPDHGHEHQDAHDHDDDDEGHHEHGEDHHHDHRDDDEHDHGHSHVPKGPVVGSTTLSGRRGEVTAWSLVSLGISGGMVPCPSALVVLLAAVALHRVAFGLCLIAAFSVGLAAVLVLLGILAVTAARFMDRLTGESRLVKTLPVLSAGVVMLVGVSIAVNALVSGGILRAGW